MKNFKPADFFILLIIAVLSATVEIFITLGLGVRDGILLGWTFYILLMAGWYSLAASPKNSSVTITTPNPDQFRVDQSIALQNAVQKLFREQQTSQVVSTTTLPETEPVTVKSPPKPKKKRMVVPKSKPTKSETTGKFSGEQVKWLAEFTQECLSQYGFEPDPDPNVSMSYFHQGFSPQEAAFEASSSAESSTPEDNI